MLDRTMFSPSAASRWIRCPGSTLYQTPVLKDLIPREQKCNAAAVGTYLHALAESRYRNSDPPVANELTLELEKPTVKAKLAKIDPYVQFIRSIDAYDKTDTTFKSIVNTETLISDPLFPEYLSGTPDYYRIDLRKEGPHEIWIVDLKTGLRSEGHRDQLQIYSEILVRQMAQELRGYGIDISRNFSVTVHYYLYYLDRVRSPYATWTQEYTEAYVNSGQYPYVNQVQECSDAVLTGELHRLSFTPGSHCGFCPGKSLCPVFANYMAYLQHEYEKPDPQLAQNHLDALEAVARISYAKHRAQLSGSVVDPEIVKSLIV